MVSLARRSSHSQCRHASFTPKGKVFHSRVNLWKILTGRVSCGLLTGHKPLNTLLAEGITSYGCKPADCWDGSMPQQSPLCPSCHICSAVTLPRSQSPLPLISPQEAASQTGQGRRWELAEREEHTAWGTSTVLGSLSCLNLNSQPITLHGPRGCPYQGCRASECCTAMPQH